MTEVNIYDIYLLYIPDFTYNIKVSILCVIYTTVSNDIHTFPSIVLNTNNFNFNIHK